MSDTCAAITTTARRKRAATPRSKTGCVTCKIRRLKCGEERPCCLRCTKSGWSCDYKDRHTKPDSQPTTPPAEVVDPSFAAILPRHPSFTPSPTPSFHKLIDLDETERLYFNAFIEDVSVQLPGHDSFFWAGAVLQESHVNYSVRHTIVAIGALSRCTQKLVSGVYRFMPLNCPHRNFALRQYEKATHGLAIPISEEDDDVRSALISCIVLAFFDNFVGNGGSALQHVALGRQIMCKSMRRLFSKSISSGQDHARIAGMFLRLESESFCAFGLEADRSYAISNPKQPVFDFPLYFMSIDDALLLRNQIVWEGYHLFYRIASEGDHISPLLLQERDIFIEHLRQLNSLLDLLVQSTISDFSNHPLRNAEALKLPPVVLLIRLVSGSSPYGLTGYELLPEFTFLLDICRAALDYETMINPAVNEREIFSFDVRVVAALSLVATRCRTVHLRRQATDILLSSHRREWMYDSQMSGKIAAWMLELEETASRKSSPYTEYGSWFGLVRDDDDPELVDEWMTSDMVSMPLEISNVEDNGNEVHRTWDPVVEWDVESERRAKVRCRQNYSTENGSIGWIWKETEIVW